MIRGTAPMDRLSHRKTILLVCLACACMCSTVKGQANTSGQGLTGSIAGRVTIAGKGAPGIAVGARPSTFSMQGQPASKGTTDPDGNYQISGLPPDSYAVAPLTPAHILKSSENFAPSLRAKTVLLAEGETANGIDFSLTRGGVITGKVSDADGRPVVEEPVQIIIENQPGRTPITGYPFQTDDRGIYRIYGIPPGRYRVAVGQGADNPYPNLRAGRVAYQRTYYPDAAEASAGEVVEVTEGSETTNIDITVGRSLQNYTATGKVVDDQGKAVAGLWFGARRQQAAYGPASSNSITNDKGEFRLENITPGKYVVTLQQREGTEMLADPAPFEVVDHDVTGLVVKVRAGQSVSGSIVIEPTSDKTAFAKLLQQHISVSVRGGRQNRSEGAGGDGTLNSDGTFRVGGLRPGTATFSLQNPYRGELELFTIVRVEREGVVQPQGLEIKDGENVAGVKLVVAYGSATIRGQIRFVNGELPANSRAFVWLRKQGDTSGNNRNSSLDARGHFAMEAVPGGSYEIVVNIYPPGREPAAKQSINVSEGATTDVEILIDLKAYFEAGSKP